MNKFSLGLHVCTHKPTNKGKKNKLWKKNSEK